MTNIDWDGTGWTTPSERIWRDGVASYKPEPEGREPSGQPVVTAGRSQRAEAEELTDKLIELIRQVVREELERLPRA